LLLCRGFRRRRAGRGCSATIPGLGSFGWLPSRTAFGRLRPAPMTRPGTPSGERRPDSAARAQAGRETSSTLDTHRPRAVNSDRLPSMQRRQGECLTGLATYSSRTRRFFILWKMLRKRRGWSDHNRLTFSEKHHRYGLAAVSGSGPLVRAPRGGGGPGAPGTDGWRGASAPGANGACGPWIPASAGNAASRGRFRFASAELATVPTSRPFRRG